MRIVAKKPEPWKALLATAIALVIAGGVLARRNHKNGLAEVSKAA